MLCGFMREEKLREGKRGEECCLATNAFQANALLMSSTIFITRVAIDCIAIDHEVIDRNEFRL